MPKNYLVLITEGYYKDKYGIVTSLDLKQQWSFYCVHVLGKTNTTEVFLLPSEVKIIENKLSTAFANYAKV